MPGRSRRRPVRPVLRTAVLGGLVVALSTATILAAPVAPDQSLEALETIGATHAVPHLVPDRLPSDVVATKAPTKPNASAEMALAPTTTAPPPPPASASPANGAVSAARSVVPSAKPVAPSPPPAAAPAAVEAQAKCVVRLHGKSGFGSATTVSNGTTYVAPTGNAAAWGGREWRYFPESSYEATRSIVANAIANAGCARVAIIGFSNGGAFAAKLFCRGETFNGRVVRVVIDDPVTDHAVEGCSPAAGVAATLYWTGALEGSAQPGWDCSSGDWTCEGGSTIGIAAYAAALGTPVKRSPNSGHSPYSNPPELANF